MRNFQTLTQVIVDTETGIISFSSSDDKLAVLSMRREGGYVAITVSYGPVEIALRPQYENLINKLARLQPVKGLQITRQVGTAEAYLGLGLNEEGNLIIRPTLVADATGYVSLNFALSSSTREALFKWLPVEPNKGNG